MTGFLLFPKRLDGQWRWLEWARWREAFWVRWTDHTDTAHIRASGWTAVCWEDEDEQGRT